jgi:hypothetical protein
LRDFRQVAVDLVKKPLDPGTLFLIVRLKGDENATNWSSGFAGVGFIAPGSLPILRRP